MTLWDAMSRHLAIVLGLMAADWQDIGKSQADHKKLAKLMLAGDMDDIRRQITRHLFKNIERVDYDPDLHQFTMVTGKRKVARAN